jgi:TonB family protein
MMQKLGPALVGAALGMLLYWGMARFLDGPAPDFASLPPASIALPPLTPVVAPDEAALTAGIRGAESGELTAGIRGADSGEMAGTMADPPAAAPTSSAPCFDHEVVPRLVVAPDYPYQARVDGQGGEVTVELTVGNDGKVSAAQVVSAEPPQVFDQAALDAVTQWQFDPRTVACAPVASQVRQVVKFQPHTGR